MFSKDTAPFGSKEAFISLDVSVTRDLMVPVETVSVWAVVLHNKRKHMVGYHYGLPEEPEEFEMDWMQLCCTPSLFDDGECGNSTVGELIINFQQGVPHQPTVAGVTIRPDDPLPQEFHLKHVVDEMGNHSVAVVLCNGSFATVTTDLAFRNPYGYLPAVYFAHLPFFGFLALSYTTLTVVLGVVLLIRRHIALPLQYAVLGLAVVSLLQYTFAFFVAQTGNETGQPPCCPARAIAVVGVLLGTLRNGLSRGLLLAVCLGFGVVHVRLDKRSTYALVALMALYIFFDANFEINVLVTDDPLEPQFWQLPVLVLDLIFLLYIYSALVNTARNLHEEQQSAKLDMYRWLGRVLGVFVLGTLTVNLVITGAVFGWWDLPWTSLWFFANFWDLWYLGGLLAVVVIWWPSERTARYAVYAQPGTGEDGELIDGPDTLSDDDVQEVARTGRGADAPREVEMASRGGRGGDGGDGGHFVIVDSEEEEEEGERREETRTPSPAV